VCKLFNQIIVIFKFNFDTEFLYTAGFFPAHCSTVEALFIWKEINNALVPTYSLSK
jgi:hypothetical protein